MVEANQSAAESRATAEAIETVATAVPASLYSRDFWLVFAATAIYIFRSDGKPDSPILMSDRGVEWVYRF